MHFYVGSPFYLIIVVAVYFPNFVHLDEYIKIMRYESHPVSSEQQLPGQCFSYQFRCKTSHYNDRPTCISKERHCDGSKSCYYNSDENYCNVGYNSCPDYQPFFKCHNGKCIPVAWKCDGTFDCHDGSDEIFSLCDKVTKSAQVVRSLSKIEAWLSEPMQRNPATHRWGREDIHRRVVSLHYAKTGHLKINEEGLFYELGFLLMEDLLQAKLNLDIGNLALYIDALLIFCVNPWNFHGLDLVTSLREKVSNSTGYVNPFVILVLCNANSTMYDADVMRLYSEFEKSRNISWIDMSSLSLMALACIYEKGHSLGVEKENISELAHQLGEKQSTNGSFGSVPSTALAAQALIASGSKNWSYSKALEFLLNNQITDGSFGSLLNTYYVAPVLRHASLLNISFVKCEAFAESGDIIQKANQDEQLWVKYSIGMGDKLKIVHTITLQTPVNSTFYHIMGVTAELETKYRFKYVNRNSKPYIYEINGIQDDLELERFWFLHSIDEANSTAQVINSSPADVIVQDKDVYIHWYRSPLVEDTIPLKNYF